MSIRTVLAGAVAWLSGVALGCSPNSDYVYKPEVNATAEIRGRTAADYPLPSAAASQGDLRVASFGIARLTRAAGEQKMHAMHVRMVVSNNGREPWVVDTREQRATVRGGAAEPPVYVNSDRDGLPMVTIPPGGKRTIDLFCPLPPDAERAARIPEFDVLWRVRAGLTEVAERTPFERLRIEPLYAYGWGYPYSGLYSFGPYGWYDPLFGPSYVGSPGWFW
jgi:hypothetical protein